MTPPTAHPATAVEAKDSFSHPENDLHFVADDVDDDDARSRRSHRSSSSSSSSSQSSPSSTDSASSSSWSQVSPQSPQTPSLMASLATYNCGADGRSVLPLRPSVKDYAWGIRGLDSRVARYALESGIIDEVDPDCPYAELWIGTHPKGRSQRRLGRACIVFAHGRGLLWWTLSCSFIIVCSHNVYILCPLLRFLYVRTQGPSTLSNGAPLEEKSGSLPFLFKVLSAGKTLSIQAHPDKSLAERLHSDNPQAYGDANHKPEMAIALTPFEAMCGFRRIEEITILLKKHPEFAACIDKEAQLEIFVAQNERTQRVALKHLFSSFMSCPPDRSRKQLSLLLKRLQYEQSANHPHPHEEPPWERKCARAILRLAQQFPNDAGAMAPFFLNYLLIAPGESFYMAANEPHAYVAGEILECMACSDNVVRAGLTPKFKDVPNLVSMLTYSMGGPSIDSGTPAYGDGRIMRYTPPCPEFEVLVMTCNPGESLDMPKLDVPAVFIVIEGSGSTDNEEGQRLVMRPGRTYYVPKGSSPLTLNVNESKRGPLKIAVAHENLHADSPTAVNPDTPRTYRGEFGGWTNGSTPSTPVPTPSRRENGSSKPGGTTLTGEVQEKLSIGL